MRTNIFIFFLIVIGKHCSAQEQAQSTIETLNEVLITADTQLQTFSDSQSVLVLSDSIIAINAPSLTSLLNYNSPIYFKENGLGMVSSPSFRGTTAQQTAVVWNGININSQLNGQTDFNTVNTTNFNNITIKSGGGSVIYGSGAIGGSIHLNNNFDYTEGFQNTLQSRYGSFNTLQLLYKSNVSVKNLSANIQVTRNSSDNDYDYIDSDNFNRNGQFYNTSLSANISYKLNRKNILKFYSYAFDGDRHFSLIFPSETATKYHDFNTRNLIEWDGFYSKFVSKLKLAYLTEDYKYYDNLNTNAYSFGKVNTLVAKYDLTYTPTDNITLNSIIDGTQNKGTGSSIDKETRQIASFNLLFKHALHKKFTYELGFRQEITNNYNSPFLYSFGFQYQVATPYTVTLNGSKNFRIPTFNDLYWEGSGNPNLKPETAYQIEIGNHLNIKNFAITATVFYNDIKDMIRWLPNGALWQPVNTDHVKTYGLESSLQYVKALKHHQFTVNSTYAYTISKNQELDTQLIYVPKHKATASLGYAFKNISAYYQWLFVSDVYTTTDNSQQYVLDGYQVSNLGLNYTFNDNFTLGGTINNLFNENYQSVSNRYMPGQNYAMHITITF
ncbi:TonB-dependent receptor plug domain-containing protein [Formosa sp. A9]|uniref:TonB-dependent receptor plug domain-containing protein n=1 Tax=Formosa sp. A9 TaxID=3442641 RepID=UPI003EC09C93